ncbi:MAG TPA: cyclic nucleotide-binding domain-containing protein [Solirubrobacteraceae bacterium]|nr:cyclic nucleotide-binding domain-containing protein [Solirubrobacteraceae bacterium]
MTVEVFRAQSEQDREELFRFRYAVYVEEMGRYRRIADHQGRRLVEPEDAHSILYGAREDGQVVGTSRLTLGADRFSPRQIDQYSLGPFLSEVPARLMAIGERLMLAPHLRGSTVRSKLRDLALEDIEAGGVRLVFGNCEPHLLSMNLSAGGRTYAERNVNSEEAGYLIPLVFLDGDTNALAAAIGSLDRNGRPCLPPSIRAALAESDSVSSASLMAPGEYWAHVEAALERLDQEDLHAFAGLDPSETRECISRSNIIECAPGDRVLKEGGSSHNLFLVLEGNLEVRHHGRLVNVLGPGDVFGEMAFLLELPRQSDVYAATPGVRILSLSDGTLHKLMSEEPTLAAKLLLNISRMLCGRLIKANAAAEV